jgi:Putative Flp pilus-assembly TadE/G-like
MDAMRATSGQTLPIVVAFMFTILIFAGLVIDLGNAYRVQQALQASADASAAAGAGTLTLSYPPIAANALAAAAKYGSQSGGENPISGVPAGNVTQNVTATCITQGQFTCTYPNTVTVNETANVPTYLLKLLGFSTIQLTAHAQACSPCGEVPLDIMLVVDRTGSMAQDNKWTDLQSGLTQGFLPGLDPTEDELGLAVLPPNTSASSNTCDPSSDGQQNYNWTYTTGSGRNQQSQTITTAKGYTVANPVYDIINPMENGYMTLAGALVNSDPLVNDIQSCMQPGGSTEYADSMAAAWQELSADGRTGVQKVIVLLSDGAANTGQNCSAQPTSVDCMQPCQAGVNEAATLKAAPDKVLVYTILYGPAEDFGDCTDFTGNTESPQITPQTAMSEMASPGNYYPDPNPANLQTIFQEIASDIAAGTSRIVQ